MNSNNIAASSPSSNSRAHGWRDKYKRIRSVNIHERDVSMDESGDIVDRPLTRGLNCFAKPHEFFRGLEDITTTEDRGALEPIIKRRGCSGCKSREACGVFAKRRVDGDQHIKVLFDRWQSDASGAKGQARYRRASWAVFRDSCEARAWGDSNVTAIEADDEQKAFERAERHNSKRRDDRKLAKARKKLRVVPAEVLAAIETECGLRLVNLDSVVSRADARLWLRNLPAHSQRLTVDVWRLREIMERQGAKVSGSTIADALIAQGRDAGMAKASLRVVVNKAIKRIGKLEADRDGGPIWSPFKG